MTTLQTLLAGFGFASRSTSLASPSTLAQIRELEKPLAGLDDSQLRAKSAELREGFRVAADSQHRSTLAFALASEAAHRALGIRFYDVQLIAGWSLLHNGIAEMRTGEGKTFVGALASYAWALHGKGVHFMTTNDYLAERDCELVRPMLSQLGMTVGFLKRDSAPEEKRKAYLCDITYGPGYEFGFDYLRDQLGLIQGGQHGLGEVYQARRRGDCEQTPVAIQHAHFSAIVDEADSVMIDEATTPLVLSGAQGQPAQHPEPYLVAKRVAHGLVEGTHFTTNLANRQVALTKEGQAAAARSVDSATREFLRRPWYLYVQQALQASRVLARDEDYIVSEDKIKLVDGNTGRIFDDRTWSDGLHQAVEAKEQVTVTGENHALARISRQQFFRLYENLCGMTGTATDSESELRSVYNLSVSIIPTHRPCLRMVEPTRGFASESQKWDAIAQSVRERHLTGRPILIGTRTIESSEQIAGRLSDLPIQLLNGKQDADEARVIAAAGQRGAIMIATNMAGRGTDIKLGEGVCELGGLHVIVSEPHESARVDRQLVGRASRQGDPGSCQTFVSADDEVITQHAPWMSRFIRRAAGPTGEVDADLSAEIAKLQKSVERKSAAKRREMFSGEKWMEDVLETLAKR